MGISKTVRQIGRQVEIVGEIDLDRYLNVLPTITIREGYRIKVYLTNDLDLPAYLPTGLGGAQ